MKEVEVVYVPHGKEPPPGFQLTGNLAGTHHGLFADIAVRVVSKKTNQMQPIRNVYCTHKDDLVVPHKCKCCQKCWLYVAGPKLGSCPFGGPYAGYERVGE